MSDAGKADEQGLNPRLMSRLIPWGLLLIALLFAYLTRGILLPFLAGFALAYLLDPLADRLEAYHIDRGLAAGLIIFLCFIISLCVLFGLWPLLQAQLVGLVRAVPGVIADLRIWTSSMMLNMETEFGTEIGQQAQDVLESMVQQGFAMAHQMIMGVFTGGLALFNILALVLISPMVAFYILRDFDKIISRANALLPAHQAPFVRRTMIEIDQVLSGFVRGQLSVMLAMAVLYCLGWSVMGLDYALILGMLAGILGFIPFFGTAFALAVALFVGFGQWGLDYANLGLVVLVWVFVQILEGAVLTPRLLGRHVCLHPVWVIFAVFAGGEVAGFVGVLIAVPAAAVIAVLVRSSLAHYRLETQQTPAIKGHDDVSTAP
ncbi:AI-2E family transporter [Iodidimonas nitroreducens]|uniref:AI-2E family transporter n=1 Tax=Iodidimonas nitroreducens TaxID=1236968 RepID=A0A5A7N425_9PROT|nr:AI-2E family transporter [Iodidimonas nitroreducens]GAK32860.1 hypothetical protein AQ1_00735 [alpha proteobacterium Q-1]GER03011.1 AI-2E family transporter [Iodidimonas nitroreducens]